MSKLCIYTTNHKLFLKQLYEHPRNSPVWFYSNVPWKRAADYFNENAEMVVVIRELGDDEEEEKLVYTYYAQLADVKFADESGYPLKRPGWLDDNLKFHRECYKADGERSDEEIDQCVAKEREAFKDAITLYSIRGLDRTSATPITKLIKESGGSLSSDYVRGYSICRCPRNLVL